jgi:glycosidase
MRIVVLLAIVALAACNPALNVPPADVNNQKLNSLLTLEVGENTMVVQDFISDVSMVDSVTVLGDGVSVQLYNNRTLVRVEVDAESDQLMDVQFWIKGNVYSVPCRKSDKQWFVFRYKHAGKTPQRVQIAGQMNDWTPSATPDLELTEGGHYEVKLYLSPGTYLYQMNVDGEQNHDAGNPQKVDNGFGKFNSILQVPGNHDRYPLLATRKAENRKIYLSYQQDIQQVSVYWQNHRLPDHFVRFNKGELAFDIPVEATRADRSYFRIWAANRFGVGKEVLIPLHKGKPVTDASQLTRHDPHTQIMYFMLVDRFNNGSVANDRPMNRPDVHPKVDYWGGDLAGLQQKIDDGYFEKLGINTLWISPVSQNPDEPYGFYAPKNTKFSGYHGYWPVSSSKVDDRFGSNEEFKTLVQRAHGKAMNVLLDYVANHVHEAHPLYRKHPEYATDLYLPDGSLNVEKWDEHRLTTWFDTFMPSLDFSNHDVVEMMTDSAIFWLKEFNLDGFRHDACKHIPEEFWRMLTLKVKKQLPGKPVYQIGETYGSPGLIASYLTTGMLDGQFDFNVYDIANTTFAGVSGDLTRVREVLLSSLNTYGQHNLMGYISGNHDKPRFMAYASGDLKMGEDAKKVGWDREIGISDSTAYTKLMLFHAFNLTIPGVPVLFYGDEIGLTGANDPDCRKMMRFEGWSSREARLWEQVARLNHLRRANPVLMYGSFIDLKNSPAQWIYARKYFGKEAVVLFNTSDLPRKMSITLPEYFDQEEFTATFGHSFSKNGKELSVELPAMSVEILM